MRRCNGWASEETYNVALDLIRRPELAQAKNAYKSAVPHEEMTYAGFLRFAGLENARTSKGTDFQSLNVNDWEIVEGVLSA